LIERAGLRIWASREMAIYPADIETPLARRVSLCELLDRVLNKGAVLTGEISISVADVELLYIGLSLVISSVETLMQAMDDNCVEARWNVDIN
jgi:hypothetical protein